MTYDNLAELSLAELVNFYEGPARQPAQNDPQLAKECASGLGWGMLEDSLRNCMEPGLKGSAYLAALSTCEQMDFEIAYCALLSHETKLAFRVQFVDECDLAFQKFRHHVRYGGKYGAFKEGFRDLLAHLVKFGIDKEGVNLEEVAPVFKEMQAALAKYQEGALQMRLVNPESTAGLLYLYYVQAKKA